MASGMRVIGGGRLFPEKSNVPWEGDKPIYHFVYKLRQATERREQEMGLPPKSLVLFKQQEPLEASAETAAQVVPIVEAIAKTDGFQYPDAGSSSVHINLRAQCWVIIELDRKTNWRFVTSHAAITTKEAEPEVLGKDGEPLVGHNTDLHYVFRVDDKVVVTKDETQFPKGAPCHLVFFRITYRKPDTAMGMNFAVELYHCRDGCGDDDHGPPIPIIIDPDVPDRGNGGG